MIFFVRINIFLLCFQGNQRSWKSNKFLMTTISNFNWFDDSRIPTFHLKTWFAFLFTNGALRKRQLSEILADSLTNSNQWVVTFIWFLDFTALNLGWQNGKIYGIEFAMTVFKEVWSGFKARIKLPWAAILYSFKLRKSYICWVAFAMSFG